MSRSLFGLASALVLLSVGATPAHAFLGFGKKPDAKPAAAAPSKGGTGTVSAKPAPPRKASVVERVAAERLDPLARATFWGREADLDPSDVTATVAFSSALRAMGRYPEAAQAAQQALVVDPKSGPALMAVARAEIGANRGFYALEYLRRAEVLQPGDWRPVSLEGVALEQAERPAEARDAYARALKLSPNNPSVLSNLALSHASSGDPARAEQLLRTAVAQPGAGVQERQNLALVLGLQGRMAEAERLIRQDLPPEVAGNNLAYLRSAAGGPPAAGRSWAGVKGAETALQR